MRIDLELWNYTNVDVYHRECDIHQQHSSPARSVFKVLIIKSETFVERQKLYKIGAKSVGS